MKDCNLIDNELWTLARWRDISFLLTPDLDYPGGIGLIFENYDAGQRIFESWRETLGETDLKEMLRVSILHGTTRTGKRGYTVHLTTDPMSIISVSDRRPQEFLIGSRFLFKETLSNEHLDWFIASFDRHKRYVVFPNSEHPTEQLNTYVNQGLWKTKFFHCDFSVVDPNGSDGVALPD